MLPLRDTHTPGIIPFWVIVIIAINIFVFYLELTASNPDQFIFQYALVPAFLNFSEPVTLVPLITSQFLHGGFLHIISNMWFLWVFGDNIENRLGFLFFPIFYLLSGVVGGLLQLLFVPPNSQIPMLGASGSIAGVLGAYFVLFPNNTIRTLLLLIPFITVVNIPAYFMLIYWFLIQLLGGFATIDASGLGGVAYFAHVGGFATGWIVGKIEQSVRK